MKNIYKDAAKQIMAKAYREKSVRERQKLANGSMTK